MNGQTLSWTEPRWARGSRPIPPHGYRFFRARTICTFGFGISVLYGLIWFVGFGGLSIPRDPRAVRGLVGFAAIGVCWTFFALALQRLGPLFHRWIPAHVRVTSDRIIIVDWGSKVRVPIASLDRAVIVDQGNGRRTLLLQWSGRTQSIGMADNVDMQMLSSRLAGKLDVAPSAPPVP